LAEYVGSERRQDIQRRLWQRRDWISSTPGVSDGGTSLGVLDPARAGWERLLDIAHEDGILQFLFVDRDACERAVATNLGAEWKTIVSSAHTAAADKVLEACERVIAAAEVPAGWRHTSLFNPTESQIAEVQALNLETGLVPYPAFYARSESVPVVTTCLYDDRGALAATASGAYRFHPASRLAGHLFGAKLSVAPERRRMGMGKYVNAIMLRDSHAQLSWSAAIEQATDDNGPALSAIAACGLAPVGGLTSVAATVLDEAELD